MLLPEIHITRSLELAEHIGTRILPRGHAALLLHHLVLPRPLSELTNLVRSKLLARREVRITDFQIDLFFFVGHQD